MFIGVLPKSSSCVIISMSSRARNVVVHFDSGHQHKPRHVAPPTLPAVFVTGR